MPDFARSVQSPSRNTTYLGSESLGAKYGRCMSGIFSKPLLDIDHNRTVPQAITIGCNWLVAFGAAMFIDEQWAGSGSNCPQPPYMRVFSVDR